MDLSGTVAVVTGAGGVLGGGIARAFAAAGAAVVAHYRNSAAPAAAVVADIIASGGSVSPGLIWRDGLDHDWPEGVERYRRAVPLGRLGVPADVGRACVFLASPMAEWITGHDLVVHGGVSVHPTW